MKPAAKRGGRTFWRRANPFRTRYDANYAWFSRDGQRRFMGPMAPDDVFKVLCSRRVAGAMGGGRNR